MDFLEAMIPEFDYLGWSLYQWKHNSHHSFSESVEFGPIDGIERKIRLGELYKVLPKVKENKNPNQVLQAYELAVKLDRHPMIGLANGFAPLNYIKFDADGAYLYGDRGEISEITHKLLIEKIKTTMPASDIKWLLPKKCRIREMQIRFKEGEAEPFTVTKAEYPVSDIRIEDIKILLSNYHGAIFLEDRWFGLPFNKKGYLAGQHIIKDSVLYTAMLGYVKDYSNLGHRLFYIMASAQRPEDHSRFFRGLHQDIREYFGCSTVKETAPIINWNSVLGFHNTFYKNN